MIDVPRREIISLDSQIEKINHLGPLLISSWEGFKRSLSGGTRPLPLSLQLPDSALPWWFLRDCGCIHGRELDLGLLC